MESAKQAITIRSSVDEMRHIQAAVQQALRQCGYDEDSCFAVKLALEESIINAIKHGNKFDASRMVHVKFEIDDQRAWFSIRDEGHGFNPAHVPDPTAEENLAKPSGRGIMLMKAYMDEVSYTQHGSEVVLVKKRKP